MAKDGFIWTNKIQVLGNIKANLALVDIAAKDAVDEHLNEVEKITKSEKRLHFGYGIKTGNMRSSYRHNDVVSSKGIATGETFNDVSYAGYVENRWGHKYANFGPSIMESQVNIDKIVSKSFKTILNL